MTDYSKATDLFSPTRLGAIEVSNRIAMAPLTRSRVGEDGVPGDLQATYYAQRAGAGLIVSEATNISPEGRGYAMTPGIWTDEQVAGWRRVTDAVHAAGGKIVNQLWHVGRISHVDLQPGGQPPVAPSAITAEGKAFTNDGFADFSTPRALETDEIPRVIADYTHAAQMAKEAGFDGVEVHSANSYLLDQFIRDATNKRTDAYGGSIANRTRLTLEVVEAVAGVWGHDRVGIRLSPTTPDAGNTPHDSDVMATYGYLIKKLNNFELAYMHFVEGDTGGSRATTEGIDLDALRALFTGPYIGNNGYDFELAKTRRAAGLVDMVAFGRPFIGNPDLVTRLRYGIELTVAAKEYFYGGDATGYTDFATAAETASATA
jgi:N-ethylmaleimide reductase